MKVGISKAESQLENLIQLLLDGKEREVILLKDGKSVVKIVPYFRESKKRIGIAKKEMVNFDLDLEEFNSISLGNFEI